MWGRSGRRERRRRSEAAEGWLRCPACAEIVSEAALTARHDVCPACGLHHPMGAEARLAWLADPGTLEEIGGGMRTADPLGFRAGGRYRAALERAAGRSGSDESLRAARLRLSGRAVVAMAAEPQYLGGSVGAVAASRLRIALDLAAAERVPALLVAAGGGLRFAEGMAALASLPEVADARASLYAEGVPFLAVIAPPPPRGGLLALALSADVVLSEPLAARPPFTGVDADASGGLVAAGLADRETPRDRLRQELLEVLDRLDAGR